MQYDKEGFAYPLVDQSRCVGCGACEKTCPMIHAKSKQGEKRQKAYIVQNKNAAIRHQSTAGGAFSAIAEYVIDQGGVVFGVEMQVNHFVHHVKVESREELYKFRGSKYVQSDTGNSFTQVKECLEKGKLVCFSGTPCQIEGLRSFLRNKSYKNLILVDVVCRAVPSPGIWKKYIEMEESRYGKLKSIRFRDKELGYQFSTMALKTDKGTVIRGGIESQPWLRMFFSGMIIRPSCTDCKFRNPNRSSDFTIWDCYNVYDFDKSFDECVGTTRVLVQNDRAQEIFDQIKSCFHYKEIPVQKAISGVREMKESPHFPLYREKFFESVDSIGFEETLKKYYPNTWKIKLKKATRLWLNRLGLDRKVKRIKYRLEHKKV